jgi:aldehyde dehydrogenase (NAD+)
LPELPNWPKKRKVGNPFDDDTLHGPQTSEKQFNKIMKYIQLGKQQGARLVTGGERVGDKGFFIQPTIFADVTDDMAIARDEIFGPVMVILKFTDINNVIDRANNSIYGLTAGVSSRDVNKCLAVANNLAAGTVWVNCWHVFDPAAPWGGYKQSGLGRELGESGIMNYLELKCITTSLVKASQYLDQRHAPVVITSQ